MTAEDAPLVRATVRDLPVTVRAATPADADAVAALVHSAYRSEESRRGWTTEADLVGGQRTDPDTVRDLTAGETGLVLVAVADVGGHAVAHEAVAPGVPDVLACCHLERRETSAYLGMFAVQPDRQGQGIGQLMLTAAQDWAHRTWGASTLEISVLNRRPELVAWYERCGFALTGHSHPFPYGDERFGIPRRPDLELLVMTKALGEDGAA